VSDATLSLVVLGATVALFVWNRLSVGVLAILCALALFATGLVDATTAVSGFGDPVVVFIACLFVLAAAILLGWGWAAMASVAYGTIGLAIDLATVVSILGGREGSDLTIALSVVNGSANFALIVFGGRAFWTVLQGLRPRGSRPPNPPSPSPSSRA